MKKLSDLWTGPEFQSPIEKRLLDIHQRETFIHDPAIQGQEHVFKGTIGVESDHKGHLADQDLETAKANYDSHRDDEFWPDYPDMDEVEESADLYYESADEKPKSGGPDHDYTHHVFDYTGQRGEEEHHDMKAAAAKRGVKLRSVPGQKHAKYGGKHITLRGKKADVKHVMDNHIGSMDESIHEAFLAEGPSDKWMTPLLDAIEKNKDKPEFMRFINQYQAWMETYDRAHSKLMKSKGIEGNLARGILGVIGINEGINEDRAWHKRDDEEKAKGKDHQTLNYTTRGGQKMKTAVHKDKAFKAVGHFRSMGHTDVHLDDDAKVKQKQKAQKSASQNKSFRNVRSRMEEKEVDEAQIRTRARVRNDQEKLKKARDAKSAKAKNEQNEFKLDGRRKEFKEKLKNLFYSKMAKEDAKDSTDIMNKIVDRLSKD